MKAKPKKVHGKHGYTKEKKRYKPGLIWIFCLSVTYLGCAKSDGKYNLLYLPS